LANSAERELSGFGIAPLHSSTPTFLMGADIDRCIHRIQSPGIRKIVRVFSEISFIFGEGDEEHIDKFFE
jgi:hypothetical protein